MTKSKDRSKDSDKVVKILKRYHQAKEVWSSIFAQYVEDQRFANGDQWDPKVKKMRDEAGLSTLVYNTIESKIKYIVNNARANTPSIKCNPISGGASVNTAKVFDGIIKHIQYKYDAKHAYINALSNVVIGGIGAWKVLPIRDGEDFDIEIQRITDPTKVVMDPNARKQDFSDAEFCFIENWMAKDEYEELYPDEDSAGFSDEGKGLFTKDAVLVLEYWVKDKETNSFDQYILSGDSILEANTEYRGKYIPVVFVTGEEKHIEDEREYKGVVRGVKDMQMLLNLSKSRTADYIARSSNQQWLAEVDQIGDFADMWSQQNVDGVPVLLYKGTSAGSPTRIDPPVPPTGFMQAGQEADADIRAAIGIRDPLQDIPQSQSGKAIDLQISQGNIGTFGYMDKLNSAIKYTGTILVDLIPHYFSYPHIREIMGIDGQVSSVPLNVNYQDNGQAVMHDLSMGKYAVMLNDGPSYESQRSEAADKLMEMAHKYPEFMHMAGDIMFRQFDFEGASEIADRLKATIPPNILAASNPTNGDAQSQTNAMQAQLQQAQLQAQQMQEQMKQMSQQLQQLTMEKQAKTFEIQARAAADKDLKTLDFQHQLQLKHLESLGKERLQGADYQHKFALQNDEQEHDLTKIRAETASEVAVHTLDQHAHIFHRQMEHELTPPIIEIK
jgi:DNA-binding protein YbaB